MTFGEWLKKEREARNLTQAEFAASAGISRCAYSRSESGAYRHRLYPLTLRKIASALGYPEQVLTKMKGELDK